MSVLRVTCITRSNSAGDGVIQAIGGDGFYHSIDEAARHIDSRTHQYWTEMHGDSVWLQVAYDPEGMAYLKTDNEDFPPDDLLSLEECQSSPEADSSTGEESTAAMVMGDNGQGPLAGLAERLALRTVVRLLVLNRYGRDDARLNRNREQAALRASGAVEKMDIDEDAKEQLQEALAREFDFLFAPAPKR